MRIDNYAVYNQPEAAAFYAGMDGVTDCEELLFAKYIGTGMDVLDLGVGGGRTTSHLAARSARYVGVDFSKEMIQICQRKFPTLDFRQENAANLNCFDGNSFAAVVFAFNGIDTLDAKERTSCYRECYRVLRAGGYFIFSSHNPRAVFVHLSWSRQRVDELALKLSRGKNLLFSMVRGLINCLAAVRALLISIRRSAPRIMRRVVSKTFWKGEGYWIDQSHGGLIHHYSIPEQVISEVKKYGFRLQEFIGEDYPASSHKYFTRWYYYVFQK